MCGEGVKNANKLILVIVRIDIYSFIKESAKLANIHITNNIA